MRMLSKRPPDTERNVLRSQLDDPAFSIQERASCKGLEPQIHCVFAREVARLAVPLGPDPGIRKGDRSCPPPMPLWISVTAYVDHSPGKLHMSVPLRNHHGAGNWEGTVATNRVKPQKGATTVAAARAA